MKQLINILTGCIFLWGMSSCEKDLPVYETPDCWLNFVYYSYDGSVLGTEEVTDEMRYASYSFVYVGDVLKLIQFGLKYQPWGSCRMRTDL